jgi:hypothetical protein
VRGLHSRLKEIYFEIRIPEGRSAHVEFHSTSDRSNLAHDAFKMIRSRRMYISNRYTKRSRNFMLLIEAACRQASHRIRRSDK